MPLEKDGKNPRHGKEIMKLTRLLLAFCLLASLGCSPDIGNIGPFSETLTVSVTTVGVNFDPDGYMLSITGTPDTPIGVNATMAFSVIRADITIELNDIASNCATVNNPRTISVRSPRSTTFVVECG